MKNLKQILYYSVLTGLFLIPFIPFLVPTSMFFPFITGKGFAFRILTEIVFGLYVLLALYEPEYRPKDSWITRAVTLFTICAFVADIFGQNPYKSLWSNYERMEGFVLIAHLFLYYITASSFFRTNADWKKFFNISIFASVLMSFYAVTQLLGISNINQGVDRVDARFGNATYFAIYLVFHIFLSLYYLVQDKIPKWQKYMYSIFLVFELVILYYTATRGAILGLIGGVVVSAIYFVWKERENKLYRKISYAVLGVMAIGFCTFMLVKNTTYVRTNPILSRFSTISVSEIKTQGRYFVWPMAIKGFVEKPVLGWGQDGFNYVFNKNYNPQMFGQEEWFDRSHNVFLDWLIAGGLLGFLSYILMYVALLYYVFKTKQNISNADRAVVIGMICAYVFHNIFVFDNLVSYIMFFSVLAFIHSTYAHKLPTLENLSKKTISKDAFIYVALPVVTVSVVLVVYFVNVPAILANQSLISAMSPQGDVKKNLEYFKQAYSYNSFGNDEITEQVVQMAISVPQTASSDIKKLYQDFAEEKIKEKVNKTPHDARYLVFAGSFFDNLGRYSEASEYLNRAIIESPNKQSILLEIGNNYLGQGNLPKMFEYFKKAYDLKPSYIESAKILALGAIYTKNVKVLQELSSRIDVNTIVNDNRFLKAYVDIGEFNTAINILNTRLQADPKNLQNKLTLASVYTSTGQKQKAIEILNSIAVDHPEYKDQIDSYIKQINSN